MGGVIALGRNLSPFPRPVYGGKLVTTGMYGFVRHPLYLGVLLGCLGWAFVSLNLPRVFITCILGLFLDAKSESEELFLTAIYPDYAFYQCHVKKILPWICGSKTLASRGQRWKGIRGFAQSAGISLDDTARNDFFDRRLSRVYLQGKQTASPNAP